MSRPGSEDGAVYRKTVPASRRYGVMERTAIEKSRKDLEGLVEKLDMLIDEMKELRLARISMDGITKGDRGIDLISMFIVKIDQAIARER
jgi:hypothetical protein